jgi:hypothetical protein
MFTRSPIFMRMQSFGQRFVGKNSGGVWGLLMTLGVVLTLLAVAILVWPELLAYMVASALLFAGVTLMAWSWRLRRLERRLHQHITTIDRDDW